jgi:hypothetical protein
VPWRPQFNNLAARGHHKNKIQQRYLGTLPKFATLIDNFATNDLATRWPGTYGTTVWSVGQVSIQTDTGYSSGLETTNLYDLTSSYFYLNWLPYTPAGNSAQISVNMYNPVNNNGFFFGLSGTNFNVTSIIGGVQTAIGNNTYVPSTMSWIRVRELNGTTFFDTAPDGVTWTNQFSFPNSTWVGCPLTQMALTIFCGDFGSDPTGTTIINCVNTTVSAPRPAGLATATGGATQLGYTLTAALATGVGTSQSPGITITAGLATAGGAATPVTAPRIAGLATALGTSQPVMVGPLGVGLASGVGAANAPPQVGITPVLATATGTAFNPSVLTGTTITAGLATAIGTAFAPGITITAGLATALGVAQPVTAGMRTAGLAMATGTAQPPGVTITVGLATASGAALAPAAGLTPALATATGTAQAVTAGARTAGLATAPGAAFAPGVGIGQSLATGSGTAQPPGTGITVGLATATGTALNPSVQTGSTILAGLATASGIAQAPGMGITTGLATGTGSGTTPTAPRTTGLASGTSNVQAPGLGVGAGLPSALGAALAPTIQILRNPLNLGGTVTTVHTIGGTAVPLTYDGTAVTVASTYGGGAVPVTYDGGITLANYGGSAVTTANTYGGTVTPPNFGGGAVPVTYDGGITLANYGGSAVTQANTYGGTITLPNNGGGVTPETIDGTLTVATLSGTAVTQANTYGGTVANVTIDGSLTGWTMQQVALTLAENNDESVNVTLTQNGSALNLTSATVNMYLKTAAGTPDGSATLLSSAGGSPAITITNASGGLCTVAIPRSDLGSEAFTFYRIDVVFSGLQNTAIYGSITWITL